MHLINVIFVTSENSLGHIYIRHIVTGSNKTERVKKVIWSNGLIEFTNLSHV